jgi:kinesin family member 20
MIVNVNPYDTGFDENSHVMKFAALAKEVCTPAPVQRAFPKVASNTALAIPQRTMTRGGDATSHRRQVTISTGGQGGRKVSQTQVEVVEGRCIHDEQTLLLTVRRYRGRRRERVRR